MANNYIKLPIIGGFTLISEECAEQLNKYRWFVDRDGYATAFIYTDKITAIRMHNLLVQRTPELPCIDHINRVRLDNRLTNLRATTFKEQYANRGKQMHCPDTPYLDSELRIPKIHRTTPLTDAAKRLIRQRQRV